MIKIHTNAKSVCIFITYIQTKFTYNLLKSNNKARQKDNVRILETRGSSVLSLNQISFQHIHESTEQAGIGYDITPSSISENLKGQEHQDE